MTMTLLPAYPADRARWEHTRRRRRLLDEMWEEDVIARLSERLTPGRVVNLGKPVTSLNLFASTVRQLAVQYDSAPTVRNDAIEGTDASAVWALIQEDTHIWELAQANAEAVVGLRENLVRVNRTPQGVRLAIVYPDTVEVETDPNDPSTLTVVREAGFYTIDKKQVACWTIWDISNPELPTRTIVNDKGEDVSRIVDPEWGGWRDFFADGTPFLPYVRYRAKWSPKVWDAYSWSTLVESAIDCAILWTAWNKWVMDASWSQRYIIDLMLQGLTVSGTGAAATASIEADPASILCFKTIGEKTGSASQFSPPGDPKSLADAIMSFQGSVLSNIGIHPADLEATAQPSSGVAIQLKRSAQRQLASKMLPQFRAGDLELLKKIAATYNSMAAEGAPALPEDGWALDYHLPDAGSAEMTDALTLSTALIDAGLASKVDVYMKFHPELSRDEAFARLLDIQAENAKLSATTAPSNP